MKKTLEELNKRYNQVDRQLNQLDTLDIQSSRSESICYYSTGDVYFIDSELLKLMSGSVRMDLESECASLSVKIRDYKPLTDSNL